MARQTTLGNWHSMRGEESIIQGYCVSWFRSRYKLYGGLLWATPNGGHRNKATAGILKAEGVRRGVADLQLAVARGGAHGLFIEVKTSKGAQQPEQKQFQADVEAQGYQYILCRSVEEFIATVTNYLNQ